MDDDDSDDACFIFPNNCSDYIDNVSDSIAPSLFIYRSRVLLACVPEHAVIPLRSPMLSIPMQSASEPMSR